MRQLELTSAKNPIVLAAKELQSHKGRQEQGAFLCDGEHMAGEALAVCPDRVRSVFVQKERMEWFHAWQLSERLPESCPCYCVPAHVMEAISQVKTPQGIAAVVTLPEAAQGVMGLGNRLVLLENVQDPGNVGTIVRTLDAAGFDGCVLTQGCADPYAPKTLRATMGSALRIPMRFVREGAQAAADLRALGYAVIASVLDGQPFYEREPLPEKVCLVVGNEGAGISAETAAQCTHQYRLPMHGGAESLNAAIAAAVMMYEIVNRG